MIKKPLLLFKEESKLRPVGGPTGYLYNLKRALDLNKVNDLVFLQENKARKPSLRERVKDFLPNNIVSLVYNYKLVRFIHNDKFKRKIDLSSYSMVHFHSTLDLYMNRSSLEDFDGIILLSSHSPKPLHLEIIQDQLSAKERFYLSTMVKNIEKIDEYAFNRTDYIIFPCEEAEEPYYNNWPKYEQIKDRKKACYKYLATGVETCQPKLNPKEVKVKYGIPDNAFVVCYVGRHNEVKGYNLLKDIGKEIIDRTEKVYFLIAGVEEPIKGLDNSRWIEVGWTNDPHSIIAASDIFILPNKETYFDLIMLEVLSLGKVILASNTGGNKYFNRFKDTAIILFDSRKELVFKLLEFMNLPSHTKTYMGLTNKNLFDNNFTTQHFLNNYLKVINEIREETDSI